MLDAQPAVVLDVLRNAIPLVAVHAPLAQANALDVHSVLDVRRPAVADVADSATAHAHAVA